MEPILVAKKLMKKYGNFTAVNQIDFEVYPGECFGFLGPNGAGKTSTMRMISCFSPIAGGLLEVFEEDVRRNPRKIKAKIGLIPQENNLDYELSVFQNLTLYARYFDIPERESSQRAEELLRFFMLEEKRNARVQHLSGGMTRRLLIARALINNPKMLLLDEPTTGLDPQARHHVWHKLRQLKELGVTMILTTHYMEEASRLCDRLVIMNDGVVLAGGSPAQLIRQHVGEHVFEVKKNSYEPASLIQDLQKHSRNYQQIEDTVYVFAKDKLESEAILLNLKGIEHCSRPATLEDVFLKLTGKELE